MKALVWAHRGASHYAPENTLAAFALAAEMGADGVELDVHLSRDGQLIVCHDEKIDRTSTGSGSIRDYTLQELRQYNFGKNFPDCPFQRVPTLDEVYELLEPTGLTVNVELKTDAIHYEGIEQKCVECAARHNMTDRVIYSSFNHESLRRLKQVLPTAETGLLYGEDIPDAERYAAAQNAQALHPWFGNMYKEGAIARAHALGIRVHPWTVNEEDDMRKLLDLHADALITNKPDVALRIRGERI